MKKVSLVICMILLISVSLLAKPKVAILNFSESDTESQYLSKLIMKPDFFVTVFENSNFDLVDSKQIKEVTKKYKLNELKPEDYKTISSETSADIIVLGTVSASSGNYNIKPKLYLSKSNEFKQLIFSSSKKKEDCVEAFKKNLLPELGKFLENLEKDYSIALQQYATQNYSQAKDSFIRALSITPDKVEIFNYLSTIYYIEKNYEEAINNANRGLSFSDKNSNLILILAQSYRKLGNTEEALKNFIRLNEVEKSAKNYYYMAEIYLEIFEKVNAENALVKALELDAEYEDARVMLYEVYYEDNKFEEMIPLLEVLTQKYPDNETYQKRLSAAYLKTNKLDKAIENYTALLQKDPNNENTYKNLAIAYRYKEDYVNTEKTLIKLKELNPENDQVYSLLSDLYLAQKNYEKSESNAIEATKRIPDSTDPYLVLSKIYQMKGYNKYEAHLKKDEEGKNLYGADKDKNIEERDKLKAESYAFFVKSDNYLKEAESRAQNDRTALNEIKQRKIEIEKLKKATEPDFFNK